MSDNSTSLSLTKKYSPRWNACEIDYPSQRGQQKQQQRPQYSAYLSPVLLPLVFKRQPHTAHKPDTGLSPLNVFDCHTSNVLQGRGLSPVITIIQDLSCGLSFSSNTERLPLAWSAGILLSTPASLVFGYLALHGTPSSAAGGRYVCWSLSRRRTMDNRADFISLAGLRPDGRRGREIRRVRCRFGVFKVTT